jgi:hypothetical protein
MMGISHGRAFLLKVQNGQSRESALPPIPGSFHFNATTRESANPFPAKIGNSDRVARVDAVLTIHVDSGAS